MSLLEYFNAWLHRKEVEKFTTDGGGNTAIRIEGYVRSEDTSLNGPSVQDKITVTTSESEVKVGSTALPERKVVTLQPIDGNIRVFFVTGLDVGKGFLVRKERLMTFEATNTQPLFYRTESGSVEVIVAERGYSEP